MMAKTTKTMKLTFLNGEKKKISITLGDAVDNLTADQVRGAMNKDGVAYYHTPQSAAYIERTVTDIFNDSAESAVELAAKQD